MKNNTKASQGPGSTIIVYITKINSKYYWTETHNHNSTRFPGTCEARLTAEYSFSPQPLRRLLPSWLALNLTGKNKIAETKWSEDQTKGINLVACVCPAALSLHTVTGIKREATRAEQHRQQEPPRELRVHASTLLPSVWRPLGFFALANENATEQLTPPEENGFNVTGRKAQVLNHHKWSSSFLLNHSVQKSQTCAAEFSRISSEQ